MARKPIKKKAAEKVKFGGIRSLDLTVELLANRQRLAESLKDPQILEDFLKTHKIEYVEKVRFKLSENFPGITFFIKRSIPDKSLSIFATGGKLGSAGIVNVPNIGKVAVTFIFEPRPMKERDLIDREKHEDAHIHTAIARHTFYERRGRTQMRYIYERLLGELISKTVEGNLSDLDHLYAFYILPFVFQYSKKKKHAEKEFRKLTERLWVSSQKKANAIENALKKMPKGEVLMVLRKTTWGNLEKNLKERIRLREQYKKERKNYTF